MRRIIVLALLALGLFAAPVGAASLTEKYESRYGRVEAKAEKGALKHPGRNVARDGLAKGDRRDERRVMRESAQRMLRWLRELRAPEPVPVVVPVAAADSAGVPAAPASSGGGGTYCGLFQFDQGTWESVGGSGSPCAASSEEQWRRAEELQRQRGNQPWPVCGQNGASLEAIAQCESGGDPTVPSGGH